MIIVTHNDCIVPYMNFYINQYQTWLIILTVFHDSFSLMKINHIAIMMNQKSLAKSDHFVSWSLFANENACNFFDIERSGWWRLGPRSPFLRIAGPLFWGTSGGTLTFFQRRKRIRGTVTFFSDENESEVH